MKGYIDQESLEKYAELAAEKFGVNFSENETYDFTRCMRSNGTYYGTKGKCRQGSDAEAKEQAVAKPKEPKEEKKSNIDDALSKVKEKIQKKSTNKSFSNEKNTNTPVPSKPVSSKAQEITKDKEEKEFVKLQTKGFEGVLEVMNKLESLPQGTKFRVGDEEYVRKNDDISGKAKGINTKTKEEVYIAALGQQIGKANGASHESQSQKPAVEAPTPSRKGEFAPARDAWKDKEALDKYTKDWQRRNGLEDVSPEHDRFHSAVHSYLGRSSEDFAKIQGTKGVTPMEEILVNHINQHVSNGGGKIDRRENLLENAREMKQSFIDGGDIRAGSKEDRNWDRSANQAARIFEAMSRRADFDQFIKQLGKYPDPYSD